MEHYEGNLHLSSLQSAPWYSQSCFWWPPFNLSVIKDLPRKLTSIPIPVLFHISIFNLSQLCPHRNNIQFNIFSRKKINILRLKDWKKFEISLCSLHSLFLCCFIHKFEQEDPFSELIDLGCFRTLSLVSTKCTISFKAWFNNYSVPNNCTLPSQYPFGLETKFLWIKNFKLQTMVCIWG